MTKDQIRLFIKDVELLSKLKRPRRFEAIALFEYPFDLQLLGLSSVYRESREQYLELGGRFFPRVASTMRSLSAQDLFANEIDYTPAETELLWFANNVDDVYDPTEEIIALERFNVISLFHEQNHRILWRMLPPASKEERELSRYLNFAESLVVMLDLALADQVGVRLSPAFERMKVIYRSGRVSKKTIASRALHRQYLIAAQFATYLILELVDSDDVLKAVDYVLPGQKAINREAVARAFDISELFTRITNPQWQERYGHIARTKLSKMHRGSQDTPLRLPPDPLDVDEELAVARYVLQQFGI